MLVETKYNKILCDYNPVSLSELDDLALMKRVDKKFVVSTALLPELFTLAKDHYQILEIEGDRAFTYNTKYMDTVDLDLYKMHHNGRLNRQKVRYRTYAVNDLTFLEIKTKNNKGTTVKTRIKTPVTEFQTSAEKDFVGGTLRIDSSGLEESLNNSFCRITLLSFKTKERISIDYNLGFHKNGDKVDLPHVSIIEVKRDKSNINSPIIELLRQFGVHPRGFSKYCMGMAMLEKNVKKNSFKPNLLHLKRIENASYTS